MKGNRNEKIVLGYEDEGEQSTIIGKKYAN